MPSPILKQHQTLPKRGKTQSVRFSGVEISVNEACITVILLPKRPSTTRAITHNHTVLAYPENPSRIKPVIVVNWLKINSGSRPKRSLSFPKIGLAIHWHTLKILDNNPI